MSVKPRVTPQKFIEVWKKYDRIDLVAEELGYRVGSTRSLANRLRSRGFDIPHKKSGPKQGGNTSGDKR